jgi:hypothetical protein
MFDLIICVYACDTIEKYKNQILKMNDTYVKVLSEYPNIKLLYFLGETISDLVGEQYINLKNVQNDYLSASFKQYLSIKYIYENFSTKFIMCIGTDTYLNIKKLNLFIQNFNYEKNLYIGGHGCIRTIGDKKIKFHSGGPGFILSKKCVELIYLKLENFMEYWFNICKNNNVDYLIPCCDVGIAYLVSLDEINTEIINIPELVFTHCNYLGIPCHPNQIDYNKLISCHNMTLNDFDNFTMILNQNNYFI